MLRNTYLSRRGAVLMVVALALSVLGAAQGPQAPPYKPRKPIAIVGGLLIDATGAPPRWDQTVLLEGERIAEIGPMEQVKIPEGAEVIEAAGMTVMPGLINSNQHLQLNPLYPSPTANLPLANVKARWEATWAGARSRAFAYLMQGVTSMRNTSGPAKVLLPVKRSIDRGEIPGPRIFLGGALFMSKQYYDSYTQQQKTPADAREWIRKEFAYHVISDPDKDTDAYLSDDFSYWKLYMADERWNGSNDFTDDQLRFIIAKAHKHGKKVDVHCGPHNDGLRRMLAFPVDTLEHPFYGHELIAWDIIRGYAKNGVIAATLLNVQIVGAQRLADPHRFDETLYAMTLDPREYRILLEYRDKMLASKKNPEEPSRRPYDAANPPDFPDLHLSPGASPPRGPSYNQQMKAMQTSKENMRRFIIAGVKFSMGTDTPSFLNFVQEDPSANEMMHMVEMGMDPLGVILASTRNGAEALGRLPDLGTIERGKLADVIVVAGNPLENMAVMKRVAYVIKGGVRYK